MWWDVDNDLLRIKGQLPAAEGAVLEKAVDRAVKQIASERDERLMRLDQLRADALVRVASASIANDPDADRATVGVHVDARVLAGEAAGLAELDCGQPIAIETAQRLACDARWYAVADGPDGLPIGIGRASRVVPPWLAREIKHRDGACRWSGCGRTGWTDIHHLVHWAEGGPTQSDNLVQLCTTHHRLVHEGNWKIVGDPNGELTFIASDGRVFGESPPPLRDDVRERVAAMVDTHIPKIPPPAVRQFEPVTVSQE